MRKLTYIVVVALVGVMMVSACDSVLNISPSDQIAEDAVWDDPGLIEAFLSEIYRGMKHGASQGKLSSIADDSHSIPDLGSSNVVQGTVTPGSFGLLANNDLEHFQWNPLYDRIRSLNIFFENIDDAAIEEELRDRLTGEAHFLRAYFYHQLLRTHGGVPIVTQVYSLDDLGEGMMAPRNSFEETVDFIVQEAEAAAELLPTTHTGTNLGRATAGAAMALRSRVLLYAASELYHENPSGMSETGYTSGQDRQALWRAAKDAAQDVMDLGVYDLFHAEPAPGDSIAMNYYQLFLTPNNGESIMERYFNEGVVFGIRHRYRPNKVHGPNGYHSWGGATPVQQLVDAFQMQDGTNFDWNDPEHAATPYENRDPRFYATILYDGAPWGPRPSSSASMDRNGVIQTFLELTLSGGGTAAGADSRGSSVEPHNATRTGYYMRKYRDDTAQPLDSQQQPGIWIYFRYAEILLNYAEASIELGEEGDARDALNQLRRRAGMPEFDADVTGQELVEQYRNERRVELVFEEHRYFDIRRWMIAPDVMNEDAQGVNIYAEATDRADRSTYSNYQFELTNVQSRAWNDRMYFHPIHSDEMSRNHNLVQNPGY